jgi:hypothetical protein
MRSCMHACILMISNILDSYAKLDSPNNAFFFDHTLLPAKRFDPRNERQ